MQVFFAVGIFLLTLLFVIWQPKDYQLDGQPLVVQF